MACQIYSGEEFRESGLLDRYFALMQRNLGHLFGPEMFTPESCAMWIRNNLDLPAEQEWRMIIAMDGERICGYVSTSLSGRVLWLRDIVIDKSCRFHPGLFRSLLYHTFHGYFHKFDEIRSYINKNNHESLHNFMKLAEIVQEKERGYTLRASERGWQLLRRICGE